MAIEKYIRSKRTQITEHFNSKEFDCKGKSCGCASTYVDRALARKLEILRILLRKPIMINSGCRCEEHNHNVGGEDNSQHIRGTAADICVKGVSPRALAKLAQSLGFDGIGMYDGDDGHFVHVDVRGYKSFWRNTTGKNDGCSGHGGSMVACPYKQGTTTLKVGSKGTPVRALQWLLWWCGFEIDVDGDYGVKTAKVVQQFQKAMRLTADGIAGQYTLAALREVRN